MPVASTRNRLTYEGYRPPPKTWQEIMEEDTAGKDNTGYIDSPALHPKKEQHIIKESPVKTPEKVDNGWTDKSARRASKYINGGFGIMSPLQRTSKKAKCLQSLCCVKYGLHCTKFGWFMFTVGAIIGGLIAGIILGILIGEHLTAANNDAVAAEAAVSNCLQSPCKTGNRTCTSTAGQDQVPYNCTCDQTGDKITKVDVDAVMYACTFTPLNSTSP